MWSAEIEVVDGEEIDEEAPHVSHSDNTILSRFDKSHRRWLNSRNYQSNCLYAWDFP